MSFSKLSWFKRLRGAGLNDAEFRVLVVLSTYTDKLGNNAFPGNTRLAADCLMQARSIRRILHRLETKGWIVETSRGGNEYGKGRANEYQIVHYPSKGDPTVRKGDPTVRKGDPGSPRKGDPTVPPSGHSHQGIASGHVHHSAAGASASPSGATRKSPWGNVPNWEAMRADYEILEEYLDKEGLIADGYLASMALGMWENGSHPLAIYNTLLARAS